MRVLFARKKLERLYSDAAYLGGYDRALVTRYRMRVELIDNAADERDFYALKSLHYEKLRGKRSRQRSMRLNDQYRLILEIGRDAQGKVVTIVGIEDYH